MKLEPIHPKRHITPSAILLLVCTALARCHAKFFGADLLSGLCVGA